MAKDKIAFMIIDMQNDFVLPDAPARVQGAFDTIPKIKEALDYARRKKWPVFHVIREYREDGSDIECTRLEKFMNEVKVVVPGTKGCEIVEELTPLAGEYTIIKPRFSAFMGTELEFMLRRLKIEKLIICGTQYPNCIRASIYDAVSHNYEVTLLTDATSAATPEIATANITDIQNIGVTCITVERFLED